MARCIKPITLYCVWRAGSLHFNVDRSWPSCLSRPASRWLPSYSNVLGAFTIQEAAVDRATRWVRSIRQIRKKVENVAYLHQSRVTLHSGAVSWLLVIPYPYVDSNPWNGPSWSSMCPSITSRSRFVLRTSARKRVLNLAACTRAWWKRFRCLVRR